MEELIKILEEIKPNVNYRECHELVDGGEFGSFEIIQLIELLEKKFGITIMLDEMEKENFNSAEALWEMVNRIKNS